MRKFLKVRLIFSAAMLVYFIIGPKQTSTCYGQTSEVIIPSNTSTGTLEKNMLFYAHNRYTVSQQGLAKISLGTMFDGRFVPSTTSVGVSETDPTVILIENLPSSHTQAGAWIGWSSRFWYPTKFKIEIYNTYNGVNQWVEVANVANYAQRDYMVKAPHSICKKIRFTFYQASGTGGRMQLSELFFIHPEAIRAYDGLLVSYNQDGKVGIGTTTPDSKLSVNGNIRAHEIKLETDNWPDYVFEEGYELPSLEETKAFIDQNGHLPGLKSAKEYQEEGVNMMELNQQLLEKIEELTLQLIKEEEERKKDKEFYGDTIKEIYKELELLKKGQGR